jgi:hypothetical protein
MALRQLLVVILLMGLLVPAGCSPGPYIRPDGSPGPEECPPQALLAMRAIMVDFGLASLVQLDARRDVDDLGPITLQEGPLDSVLRSPMGNLDPETHLIGRVWTSGPEVVIRYYEVRSPTFGSMPFCAMVKASPGDLRKQPGPSPGSAVLRHAIMATWPVDAFR